MGAEHNRHGRAKESTGRVNLMKNSRWCDDPDAVLSSTGFPPSPASKKRRVTRKGSYGINDDAFRPLFSRRLPSFCERTTLGRHSAEGATYRQTKGAVSNNVKTVQATSVDNNWRKRVPRDWRRSPEGGGGVRNTYAPPAHPFSPVSNRRVAPGVAMRPSHPSTIAVSFSRPELLLPRPLASPSNFAVLSPCIHPSKKTRLAFQ